MNKKIKLNKKRKGAALTWMLIAFVVLMILMGSIIALSRQDLHETRMQAERLQTYYIASAGAELTYAGLMDQKNGLDEMAINKVIARFKTNTDPVTEEIDIIIDEEKKGVAMVTIDKIEKDSINWIRIKSVGQLVGKESKVSTIIRINEDRINQIVRERFDNY